MFKRSLVLAIVAMPLWVGAAHAQSWDTPMFYGPKPMDELGIFYTHNNQYFCSSDCLAGVESPYKPNGLKAIWRQTGNINLGVQAGFGDLKHLGDAVEVGIEAGNSLTSLAASGLAAQWQVGAGAAFGKHYVSLSVPVGVSLGLNLGSGSTTLVPFVHPRVSFDLASVDVGGGNEETNTDIGLAVDIGAEVGLGQTLLLRAAYTAGNDNDVMGKRQAFGAGIALRMPRKVIARGR